MEKGRWVTLGSRSKGRRQRRRKASSQQPEQNESFYRSLQKSAKTPPPVAFPPREKKVRGKPNFTQKEKETRKILRRAPEESAKRAVEPIPRMVDPKPTHTCPKAVKTRDYPKTSFWKNGKTRDSKNSNEKKGTLSGKVSCGTSDVSDSTSQHFEVGDTQNTVSKKKSTTTEEIKMNWIFEQKPATPAKVSAKPPALRTSSVKQKLKSWPKIKKVASMPNLNPNAPCFQVNPYAHSFKSFTPRPPSTFSWQQPMPQQSMMTPWRNQYSMFNSYSSFSPPQIQPNSGIRKDMKDSVSQLVLPYSCGAISSLQ